MTTPPLVRTDQPFDLLEHWAVSTPEAAYFRDGQHELSFAEGYEHARKFATVLRELGVREGDIVALELSTALQVVCIPALMQLRAATTVHHEPPTDSPAFVADWLLSSSRAESVGAARTIPVTAELLRAVDQSAELRESLPYPSVESVLRIAHSSGSTGLPKPIPLTLEMVHHRALAANELAQPHQPFLSILDLSTASGFHTYIGGLLRGEAYYNPGDAAHNLRLVHRFGITALKCSPVQLSELLAEAERSGSSPEALSHLYCAGSVVPVALRERVRRQTQARLFCLYGSTEAGRCAERELTDNAISNVGRVADGTELSIVDEAGVPVPAGTTGAIRYRRAFQAREYLGDATATAATFPDGWFITGDLGHLTPDGELILDGRASEVVNVGGLKVNSAAIEAVALGEPGVSGAACTVIDDENGVPLLVLAIEGTIAGGATQLARTLNERFGALAPQTLLRVPTIPRNRAGKTDRSALAALARETLGRA